MQRPPPQRLLAEALGTFGLVAVGTGAMLLEGGRSGWLGAVGIALSFGLVVVAMVLIFGRASGAHINPAVTFAAFSAGLIARRDVLPYMLAQCVGAIAASALLAVWAAPGSALGATLPAVPLAAAFAIEVGVTGLLVYVILRVISRPDATLPRIAWRVGATVSLLAFVSGPATGASMNPARSLGPALVSGNVSALWLYLIAPVLGAWLAVQACKRSAGAACFESVNSSEPCR
ncbi:MAG: aquaporin [Planctomycetota bacterium]|nr:MAG: aquaporin [Planctomycetota bacterium]